MVTMSKEERESVLLKIEKLMPHTKAESGAVNINEIATANKLIKELMDKYDISVDEIKITSDKATLVSKEELIHNKKEVKEWVSKLSVSVATFYDCRIIIVPNRLLFIGFEMDAKVTLKMFEHLFFK